TRCLSDWSSDVCSSDLLLSGVQYLTALFVALAVTGNYGEGDQRHDARRVFVACALATALPLWMTAWTEGMEPVLMQYALTTLLRSEERRVGKEWGSQWC